jgi:hypothetical protein
MPIAHVNTEYQTHYLNLAYTPSKAISFMIAAEAFRRVPRLKNYGNYPVDSVFDVFRVSYRNNLSEMNTAEKFYYSNTTSTQPVNAAQLRAVAGVGSSVLVRYEGTGAYFLDKIEEGVWRLELMPDAVRISDPFERASADKTVTGIQWKPNTMQLLLPGLGNGFSVRAINEGNHFTTRVTGNSFAVEPGVYLLMRSGKTAKPTAQHIGFIALNEFVAPPASPAGLFVKKEETKFSAPSVDGRLELFNPAVDRTMRVYPVFNRNFRTTFVPAAAQDPALFRLAATELSGDHIIVFQYFIGDKLKNSNSSFSMEDQLILRSRTTTQPVKIRITLTDKDGVSVSAETGLSGELNEIVISLKDFVPGQAMLLPRPYPGFMPLWFKASGTPVFRMKEVEKIEITAGHELKTDELKKQYTIEIGSIWLQKNK